MNLEQLDKKIKTELDIKTKLLKNAKNTYKDRVKVKKLKHIYGENFFDYKGNTISEKKLRYWINKIQLLPDTTADIRQLNLDRDYINSVCSDYNDIAIDGFKIVNIG